MTRTDYKHILIDEQGRPVIEGATTKIRELIVEHYVHGWSPDEIHWQHPHLSLAQVHAAFAYYYDHQDEVDAEARATYEGVRQLREESLKNCAVRSKLKSLGLL